MVLDGYHVLLLCGSTTLWNISKSCELQVSSVAAQVCTVSILFLQLASDVFTDLCSQLQLKTKFADEYYKFGVFTTAYYKQNSDLLMHSTYSILLEEVVYRRQ